MINLQHREFKARVTNQLIARLFSIDRCKLHGLMMLGLTTSVCLPQ